MEAPLKHLFCIYPWMAIGGADKFNLDMVGQLRQRGWTITIATTLDYQHTWRAQFEQLGVQIEEIGTHPTDEQPLRLAQTIVRHQPGWVLVSNSALGYAALPYLRAHAPQATFVDYNHAVDSDDPRGGYAANSVDLSDLLDLQITASHNLRLWMIEHGGHPQQIEVCTINIDAEQWNPAAFDRAALRAELGIPAGAFVGLMVARLERVKRPALAGAIMRQLTRELPDAYFVIAGSGPYAPFLRSYIRRNRLEQRVRMLGAITHDRIRELLALGDALLLPSQMEGVSLAVYEAMAMGVVPVSVAAGGQSELVTPPCGILVPHGPGEQQAYVDALHSLATDRARLAHMSAAARRRVREYFRLDQMGDRMDALLQQAATRHKQRAPVAVAPDVARAAAKAAQEIAARDARWAHSSRPSPGPTGRQRVRALFWRLVDGGAWWLVPLLDDVRAYQRSRRSIP